MIPAVPDTMPECCLSFERNMHSWAQPTLPTCGINGAWQMSQYTRTYLGLGSWWCWFGLLRPLPLLSLAFCHVKNLEHLAEGFARDAHLAVAVPQGALLARCQDRHNLRCQVCWLFWSCKNGSTG